MSKRVRPIHLVGTAFSTIGLVLLSVQVSPWATLAVFLIVAGNNMERDKQHE